MDGGCLETSTSLTSLPDLGSVSEGDRTPPPPLSVARRTATLILPWRTSRLKLRARAFSLESSSLFEKYPFSVLIFKHII